MNALRAGVVLLFVAGCTSSVKADAGLPDAGEVDAGEVDAGTPPVAVTPARVSGWEDRLLTFKVTSSVEGIASREVTVLLPPGYAEPANQARRYPVLYMHDGNNCLDHDGFQHGGWQVHTISTDLVNTGKMAPVIFVLVDNTSSRTEEYVRGQGTAPGPTADGYLDFLERDVVPWVERTWRTQAGPAGRGLGGSSYGGLISLDGAWRRTGKWGVVMAMSPAYGYDFIAFAQAGTKLPLKVYLDSGTTDYSGGDDFMARTIVLRDALVAKGWVLGTDLQHVIGQGQSHSENYWRLRLPDALAWLYPP
jgi:predicted alpha/beta superfamily hydrolase